MHIYFKLLKSNKPALSITPNNFILKYTPSRRVWDTRIRQFLEFIVRTVGLIKFRVMHPIIRFVVFRIKYQIDGFVATRVIVLSTVAELNHLLHGFLFQIYLNG